ncbi:MAG: FkbM family methyltransferase [Rhodospirillales bacterium]|jgi:FkbM family methyltransferase
MPQFRFGDLTFRAKLSYMAHAFKGICKQHHTYLFPVMRKVLADDAVVFDVGGHGGQYAKLFAKVARRGKIFSFEPSGYSCSILRRVISTNRLKHVKVFHAGLSDTPGTLALKTPLKKTGTFRYGVASLGDSAWTGDIFEEECPLVTIDGMVESEKLTRLDFIKIDVEGWEHRVIMGGQNTIQKFHPAILVELVDDNLARADDTLQNSWDQLTQWGYRPMFLTDPETLINLDKPTEGDIYWFHDQGPNPEVS